MKVKKQKNRHVYWNPYFGGFLLGILIILTFYFTGRGLGASGALKSGVVAMVHSVAPAHAENNAYYSKFIKEGESPLSNWLVFEAIGVLLGAFLSGAITGRLKLKVEHSPKITGKRRLIFALIGGFVIWSWGTNCSWLYKWSCFKRYGSFSNRWIYNHVIYFWYRLPGCLLF